MTRNLFRATPGQVNAGFGDLRESRTVQEPKAIPTDTGDEAMGLEEA
jgi:hypothetical protein